MIPEPGRFATHDVDLAAFLMLNGLKFIESKIDPAETRQPRVIMHFFDERGIALDLERVYMSSEFKKYRDLTKYLLKQVHRTIKGIA